MHSCYSVLVKHCVGLAENDFVNLSYCLHSCGAGQIYRLRQPFISRCPQVLKFLRQIDLSLVVTIIYLQCCRHKSLAQVTLYSCCIECGLNASLLPISTPPFFLSLHFPLRIAVCPEDVDERYDAHAQNSA
jgi:hypothetical protein